MTARTFIALLPLVVPGSTDAILSATGQAPETMRGRGGCRQTQDARGSLIPRRSIPNMETVRFKGR
jgi:hypothetical protein